jgi:nucleoside-diphosphate-sugar epimerase
MSKILITGAAGGLAEVVAELLQKEHTLIGVDPRPLPEGRVFPGEFF